MLVAFRRGYVPDGQAKSITQLEYETAIDEGIDVLTFILNKDATWPDEYNELNVDPKIRKWREDLGKKHGVEFFNRDPVSIDVTPALTRWVTQQNTVRSNQLRPRAETILLQQVEAEVESRLKQSLHNQVSINLGKEDRPEGVERPWDFKVKIQNRTDEPVNRSTTIQRVFNRSDINGRLLILGQPGSGKTTTLIDLAKSLVKKARDPNEPIPVLVNLSSWGSKQKPISEWLVRVLKENYGVPVKLGKQLITEQKLIPLLDGLDEVEGQHQRACVNALNQWIAGDTTDYGPGQLVICCRIDEYSQLGIPLKLNGAISLVELSDRQIETYLKKIGRSHLWVYLYRNKSLKDIVRAPLFLSMLTVSELEATDEIETLFQSNDVQIRLLDIYVRMRLANSKLYTNKQMQAWLVWLAQQLEASSETEYLVEKMQPSCLPNKRFQRLYLHLIQAIFGLTGGLMGWLMGGLLSWETRGSSSFDIPPLAESSFFLLIIGAFVGVMIAQLRKELSVGLGQALLGGVILGLLGSGIFGFSGGLIGVLIGGLGGAISVRDNTINVVPVEHIAFSWLGVKEGFYRGLKIGVIIGLSVGLFFMLYFLFIGAGVVISALYFGLPGMLIGGTIFGVIAGLIAGLKGEEIDRKSYVNQGIWRSLQLGLFQFLIFGLSGMLIVGLMGFLINWQQPVVIIGGLFAGLFGGLVGGFGTGLKHLALRWVLYTGGFIPWNYASFLNHCTDELLLQRVGGRFRFIHKTVQDHLASMDFMKP
ncbi:MAG: hypothetical protein AAGM36_12335 [Cyanobacteria bacterium J06597_1]